MPVLPGELLVKRYRIVSLLGSGQSGAVYRAWDSADKRDVALKELRDDDPETQQLFREEARRLSRVHHPQLPRVFDHFYLDEVGNYLVAEYIDGVNLQSLIDQYGPLPPEFVVPVLQKVSKPLTHLHTHDLLHLDVKPANVRIRPNGDVFLVDSGLAGLGIPVGNSGYAAPEQQTQADVSLRSDIYSLGATLYSALTAQKPVDALRHRSGLEYLRPAREINPDIPPYLSAVAARAMSLQPGARFDSAEKFADALASPNAVPVQAAAVPLRTADAAPGPPRRRAVNRRRQIEQRTIIALLVILIGVIAIGSAISFFNLQFGGEVTEAEATATLQSQVAAALTEIAPTATPTPEPTVPPTPTPEPFVHEPTGARMIFIPADEFIMGRDEPEEESELVISVNDDEMPAHPIRLEEFFIDETEVTNEQYRICVDEGGCSPPQSPNASYHPSYYGDPAFDDYPVIYVTWYQADAFCEWRDARLPTEAEWEYAAGYDAAAGEKLIYPWGLIFDGTLLNFCDSNCPRGTAEWDDGHRDTAPVTSYPDGRSPFGAYNMSGNVMEWVGDWYSTEYYAQSAEINPYGPTTGEAKVIRGGSWLSDADNIGVTRRTRYVPEVSRATLGFRCAMTPQ
ncbi:MAG: bifunctional serine/threonine-protein kinase/formylglycine-generating enzyme family protein [Anaerolineae bacterium]|nr:bifunctional serine/threonine-protein kinase/formylglycine-generating enzyme family protein [Anaerolineae bacterium]